MNLDVTQRARLELTLLVVKRRDSRGHAGRTLASRIEIGIGVALQAEQVHVAEFHQVYVGRPVGHVAGLASFHLHRLMLEHERSLLICVACKTDGVLCRGSAYLFGPDRSVGIVAIAALHQAFVHTMVERHLKLWPLLEMARIAKLGLTGLH